VPTAIRNIVLAALAPRLLHGYRVLRHLWLKPFERELALIPRYLDRDRVAVDVGANVGLMASVMARGSKRVIAFEPHPGCAQHLRRIAIRNCEVVEAAASDRDGAAILRVPHTHALGTIETANKLSDQSAVTGLTVQTQTLDSALASRLSPGEMVSFVKIDVEGHEHAVLRGARRLLETHRPVLMVEIEYRHGASVGETFALLETLGYQGFVTLDGSKLTLITPGGLRQLQSPERALTPICNVLFFQRSTHGTAL
jgi:FkbM family methyltransferase